MLREHSIINLNTNALEAAFLNDFDLDIKNPEQVIHGYASQVYKAIYNNEVVFVKINEDPNVFQVEEVAYKLFKEIGIPVPKVIAYKANPPLIGYPTIILSAAIGKTMADAHSSEDEEKDIYEHLGILLRKINDVKLEGYGKLKVINDTELVGVFKTWKEFCESQEVYHLKALNYCLDNNFITEEESLKIKEIYNEIRELNIGKASLMHQDIHRGHFFVTESKITGIIDLGSLRAGDPRHDIAMSLVFQNNALERNAFKKGYGNLVDDPMVTKYMITIFIRKIYFRSKQEVQKNISALLDPLKECLSKISQ